MNEEFIRALTEIAGRIIALKAALDDTNNLAKLSSGQAANGTIAKTMSSSISDWVDEMQAIIALPVMNNWLDNRSLMQEALNSTMAKPIDVSQSLSYCRSLVAGIRSGLVQFMRVHLPEIDETKAAGVSYLLADWAKDLNEFDGMLGGF
jgi:hypothetical protein